MIIHEVKYFIDSTSSTFELYFPIGKPQFFGQYVLRKGDAWKDPSIKLSKNSVTQNLVY